MNKCLIVRKFDFFKIKTSSPFGEGSGCKNCVWKVKFPRSLRGYLATVATFAPYSTLSSGHPSCGGFSATIVLENATCENLAASLFQKKRKINQRIRYTLLSASYDVKYPSHDRRRTTDQRRKSITRDLVEWEREREKEKKTVITFRRMTGPDVFSFLIIHRAEPMQRGLISVIRVRSGRSTSGGRG